MSVILRRTYFLLLLALLVLASANAWCLTVPQSGEGGDTEKKDTRPPAKHGFFEPKAIESGDTPWEMEADEINSQQDAQVVDANGTVILTRGADFIQADSARYYVSTRWVYLKGNVRASWQGDSMEAEEAEFDLGNMVGWLKNGKVYYAEGHIYLTGESLKRTGPSSYSYEHAVVTACDGDRPVWSFATSQGDITVEGYANLWNPRFRLLNLPILYSPYLVLPIKTQRQSGLLIPEFGSSKQLGMFINQPIYWVVDEEKDVTFFEYYMFDKSLMQGLEFRNTPDIYSKGLWKADFLYDPDTEPTEADEDERFNHDGLVRPYHERYWVRAKYNGTFLHPDWRTQLDLDWVSDQNYLREFSKGLSGFERNRKLFLKEFGRDIEDNDSLTRTNTWLIRRGWENAGLNMKAQYVENLNYLNGNGNLDNDPTLQRLPELVVDIYRTPVLDSPFEIEARTEAVYFWRRQGIKGMRLDAHPSLSLPLRTPYGTFTSRAGWRETLYSIEEYETDDPADTEHNNIRGVYDLHFSLFSEWSRIFALAPLPEEKPERAGEDVYTRLKHSMQFRADWDYVPQIFNQEDYPNFDATDRLAPQNRILYSWTNLFTSRHDLVRSTKTDEHETASLQKSYNDFLRLKFEQAYNFREITRNSQRETYPRRPFSDVLTEITLNPGRFLSLTSKTWYSPYSHEVTEHEHMLNVTYESILRGYFGVDYLRELDDDIYRKGQTRLNVLRAGGHWRFLPEWKAYVDYRTDMADHRDLERVFGLLFDHQCFTLDFVYSETPYDNRFEVKVNLKGLSGF